MADSPYIADITQANFATLVLQKSHEVPVLVDFWAAWCGPCQMLMPLLAKLADAYGGKFFLAKVNTDIEQGLAAEYGIRSLPTIRLYRNGQAVGEFMGVQPESTLRGLIDRHIAREADAALARATALAEAGKSAEALALLRDAVASDPGYDVARVALARHLLTLAPGRSSVEEAEQALGAVSIERANDPEIAALRARLEFVRALVDAPPIAELEQRIARNPGDQDARYRLSARRVLAGDYEAAMQHLLEIVRTDRKFGDDAGRKALVAIFNLLGNKNPLVPKYRALLSSALN